MLDDARSNLQKGLSKLRNCGRVLAGGVHGWERGSKYGGSEVAKPTLVKQISIISIALA